MKGLKKTLSIIALIVLIWTDFLNPISYAIEQEDVIFWVDENVNLESEEVEDVGDSNDEDVEEDEEVVEEVENIEEITEDADEGAENEDEKDWEDYAEEENTGLLTSELNEDWDVEQNVVEKWNYEDIEEMDETVDNDLELKNLEDVLEDDWNEVTLSWDNEKITWDDMVLSWNNEERIWDVETWENLDELERIRETLNDTEISGQETYKNVTVKVKASAWTFPEGVELRISPITTKS